LLYNTASTGCQHTNGWEDRGSNDAENVVERNWKQGKVAKLLQKALFKKVLLS